MTKQEIEEKLLKSRAKKEMRYIVYEINNPFDNLTYLAEQTAHALGHDEWLDDPDHWIWDLPVELENELFEN